MSPESLNGPSVERGSQPGPVERFDSLLEYLSHEDMAIPEDLFIFNPRPLEGYETASYSPSITLSRVGNDPIHIKRSYLEEYNPYYAKKYDQAMTDLEQLEKITFDSRLARLQRRFNKSGQALLEISRRKVVTGLAHLIRRELH